MKLDTKAFRYLSQDDWRVLTAVEIGSKNHTLVPTSLIITLSHLPTGANAVNKCISTLAKTGLIARQKNAKYDGYRLTYGGLDYLALHAHTRSGAVVRLGSQMGVGKESDIYLVTSPSSAPPTHPKDTSTTPSTTGYKQPQQQPEQAILKLHRLGRTSFRTASVNRAYGKGRAHLSWQHLSRLSAHKEFAAMTALREAGFCVPRPIGCNRHAVVMGLVPGTPLKDVPLEAFGEIDEDDDDERLSSDAAGEAGEKDGGSQVQVVSEEAAARRGAHLAAQRQRRNKRVAALYSSLLDLALELAAHGTIHGDFNEFNILIQGYHPASSTPSAGAATADDSASVPPTLTPWLIDFPQITSLSHPTARFYFERDVRCVKTFFRKRYHFEASSAGPTFEDAQVALRRAQRLGGTPRLDVRIEAAGFSKKMAKELESYFASAEGDGQLGDTQDPEDPRESGAEDGHDDEDGRSETSDDSDVGKRRAGDAMKSAEVDITLLQADMTDVLKVDDDNDLTGQIDVPSMPKSSPLTAEALEKQNALEHVVGLRGDLRSLQARPFAGTTTNQPNKKAKAAAGWAL